jgi:hypothetical protein
VTAQGVGSKNSAELEVVLSTAVAAARISISQPLEFTHRALAETNELLTSGYIQVPALRWKQHDFGVGVLAEVVPHRPEAVVPVDNQVTGVLQEAFLAVNQVAADLFQRLCD